MGLRQSAGPLTISTGHSMGYIQFMHLISLLLCTVCPADNAAQLTKIRIVPGVPISAKALSPAAATIGTPPTARREPITPIRAPPALLALRDRCYTSTEGAFEFSVCPFANVTQRQVTGPQHGRFWGVLGVHRGVSYAQSRAKYLMFDDGELCPGNKGRVARVQIDCQEDGSEGSGQGGRREQALHSADEPSVCNYTMTLSVPLPCSQLDQALEVEAGTAIELNGRDGSQGAVGDDEEQEERQYGRCKSISSAVKDEFCIERCDSPRSRRLSRQQRDVGCSPTLCTCEDHEAAHAGVDSGIDTAGTPGDGLVFASGKLAGKHIEDEDDGELALYERKPGYLDQGNELFERTVATLEEAATTCRKESTCVGFTMLKTHAEKKTGKQPSIVAYFKTKPNFTANKDWYAYMKRKHPKLLRQKDQAESSTLPRQKPRVSRGNDSAGGAESDGSGGGKDSDTASAEMGVNTGPSVGKRTSNDSGALVTGAGAGEDIGKNAGADAGADINTPAHASQSVVLGTDGDRQASAVGQDSDTRTKIATTVDGRPVEWSKPACRIYCEENSEGVPRHGCHGCATDGCRPAASGKIQPCAEHCTCTILLPTAPLARHNASCTVDGMCHFDAHINAQQSPLQEILIAAKGIVNSTKHVRQRLNDVVVTSNGGTAHTVTEL